MPSAVVARTVMLRLAPSASRSDRAVGDRHDAGAAVDRESSAVVIIQRVGDRVVRRIGVAGQGRHADRRADWPRSRRLRWLSPSLSRDRSDVEFIDIVDVDRHHLIVLKLPSLLVARTVMLWLAAASRSSSVPSLP